jgi:uncharacterized membrane protein
VRNIEGGVQMAKYEESIEIKRPTDQVFAYVEEIKNLPEWELTISEAEKTSPGKIGVGTTFKGKNKVMGRQMAWTSKVTEYEPNKKWGETISSGSTVVKFQMTCDPIEGGTKFSEIYDMKVGGILKLFSPIMSSSMRKQTKANLAKLKSILESK